MEERVEGAPEVFGDGGLVPGDVVGGGSAVTGAEGAVDEEEAEAPVPGSGIGAEGGFVLGDEPGAELE